MDLFNFIHNFLLDSFAQDLGFQWGYLLYCTVYVHCTLYSTVIKYIRKIFCGECVVLHGHLFAGSTIVWRVCIVLHGHLFAGSSIVWRVCSPAWSPFCWVSYCVECVQSCMVTFLLGLLLCGLNRLFPRVIFERSPLLASSGGYSNRSISAFCPICFYFNLFH